jgi:hypothetical protein
VESRLGRVACLDVQGVQVVVASGKGQMLDRELYRCVGLQPETMKLLVNKSSVHFRADFAPIASRVLVACARPHAGRSGRPACDAAAARGLTAHPRHRPLIDAQAGLTNGLHSGRIMRGLPPCLATAFACPPLSAPVSAVPCCWAACSPHWGCWP